MKSQLNEELLTAIKDKLPQNTDMVSMLMNIFPYMGKQAVYRRIRQEVPLLFDEVVKIAKTLDISIDKIVGLTDSQQAVFDFDELDPDLFDVYGSAMERYVRLFQKLNKAENFRIRAATNSLPITLYLPYDNLSKFRVYKWLYQTKHDSELSFSKIITPPKLSEIKRLLVIEMNKLKNIHLIIDNNLFSSVIDEINFFYRRNLISEDEIQLLKVELLAILDRLGKLAADGVNEFGSEISIYLSNINIDATYFYLESGNYESSRIHIHTIDGVETQNPSICKKQKQWIDSLKKFSIMISQSGEIERIAFLKKQKELILGIDTISSHSSSNLTD